MSKFQDLTNQEFGNLTVIERVENSKNGHTMWKCLCSCGRYAIVRASDLKRKDIRRTTSCGCYNNLLTRMMIGINKDLVGRKFGRLRVIEKDFLMFNGKHYYYCICDCGNCIKVYYIHLLNGGTKSCGCLRKEKSRERMNKMKGRE